MSRRGVEATRAYRPVRNQRLEETIYFFDNWYLRTMEPALSGEQSPTGVVEDAPA